LNVADVIRPYPEVIDYLSRQVDGGIKNDNPPVRQAGFLDELVKLDGGQETRDAIYDFLSKYGMRCSGEIDITKNRWNEKPITIVPIILSNIRNLEPNASNRKFEKGRQEALKK